jgi:nucleotide-binding universal stress UspA family protein
MYRTIIVPLDGSASSQAALPVAASLAHASGASLSLVRVHLGERPDLDDDPSWDQMFREGEMSYLNSLALAYGPVAGAPVSTRLLDPPVAQSLIAFAEIAQRRYSSSQAAGERDCAEQSWGAPATRWCGMARHQCSCCVTTVPTSRLRGGESDRFAG